MRLGRARWRANTWDGCSRGSAQPRARGAGDRGHRAAAGVLTKVAIHQPDGIGMGTGADHIARVREQLDREQIHIVPWRRRAATVHRGGIGIERRSADAAEAGPSSMPRFSWARSTCGAWTAGGGSIGCWRRRSGWRIRLSPIASTHGWRVLSWQWRSSAFLACDGARTLEPRLAARG